MATINAEILRKLCTRLGVSEPQVYRLIAKKAQTTFLPRHLAAVALAAENGININKKTYASEDERARIRSAIGAMPRPVHLATTSEAAQQTPRARSQVTRIKRGASPRSRKSNSVFVVHGRNKKFRDSMFAFLRAIGLNPIEWNQAVKGTKKASPYIGEVLDSAFRKAAAVVVLLTADDEARLKKEFLKPADPKHERELTGQARPNVLFEAGRAFGSHPESTVLVQIGEIRPFSDTAGVHVVHLSNDPEPRRDLAGRLEAAGCAIDISGLDWLSIGDFS
jgi:predicted nucleotide-binding protein